MPRAVQRNTSQNNKNEDDVDSSVNANTNTTGEHNEDVDSIGPRCDQSTPLSHGKIILRENNVGFETEEDLYSLKCVVDGKVKLFKKDTRVWLHKSSDKGKRKPEPYAKCCGDVPPLKIGRYDDDDQTVETVGIELREQSADIEVEHSTVSHSTGSYNLYRSNGSEIGSELSSLADSDADITYSEESTLNTSTEGTNSTELCVSGNSIETNITFHESENKLTDFSDSELNVEVKENSDSLDNLDIYDESANNAVDHPTAREISRKLSPAIQIEDESMEESLLDYAVNLKQTRESTFEAEPHFTRSSSKAKIKNDVNQKKTPTSKRKRSETNRDIDTRDIGYYLRSKVAAYSDQPVNRHRKTGVRRIKNRKEQLNERNLGNDKSLGKNVNEETLKADLHNTTGGIVNDNHSKTTDGFTKTSANSLPKDNQQPMYLAIVCSHDESPGCSYGQTMTSPLSLLYLATLALFRKPR